MRQEVHAVSVNPQIPRILSTAMLVYRICRDMARHQVSWQGSAVQAMIGHDSQAIHERYITVGQEALEDASKAFPKL